MKIKFSRDVFILAMVMIAGFYGCAQMGKIANDNPELIVKVNDLISDIIKIGGAELILQMTRADDQAFFTYSGKRLKLASGQYVSGFIAENGRVTKLW